MRLIMHRLVRSRKFVSRVSRAVVAAALIALPLGPLGSNIARADCWTGVYCPNGAFNVGAIVSSIDVCFTSNPNPWQIVFHLTSSYHSGGSGGLCGAGSAQTIQVNGGACGSGITDPGNPYQLDVSNSGCSGSFTVGFRVFAYDQSNNPKKVHGNLTINPSDFSYFGQCIAGYAPVPGC
ncbi:MAG TPA: hypothetical protein VEZ90_04170 [Blastocatellia bacterium]|nr:hypothetical protein [Blastocatellia bacterium]